MRAPIDLKAAGYPVKSVTIFSQATQSSAHHSTNTGKAEVLRAFNVELKEGENRVHIHGLSSNIDQDSARVSGLSDDVRVLDVVCSLKQQHYPAEDDVGEAIRHLSQKKITLQQLRLIRTQEANILSQYGMSLKGADVEPDKTTSFLAAYIQTSQENIQAIAKIDNELFGVDRDIRHLQDQLAEQKGSTHGDVFIVLHAKAATTVELRLTYLVHGAFWNAAYDLYATTESGQPSSSVEVRFRARVSQSTGEDWTDTSLTLSTAVFDSLGQGLPKFKSLRIAPATQQFHSGPTSGNTNVARQHAIAFMRKPQVPHQQIQQQQGQHLTTYAAPSQSSATKEASIYGPYVGTAAMGGAPVTTPYGVPAGVGHPQSSAQSVPDESEDDAFSVSELTDLSLEDAGAKARTVVSESPFSRTYRVDGQSAIPSDGRDHQVLVAVLPFEAKLSYVALPRAQTVAYMQCEVKNTSEYRLLPGPVNVFMDESIVSRTQIEDVNINDTFECTLGADPSIRLTFTRTTKPAQVEGGAFAEPTRTVAHVVTTTVKNTHSFDLPRVIVRDSVPVAGDDKRIRVVLRKPEKLAEAKEGEAVHLNDVEVSWGKNGVKDGKFEWITSVKRGEEVKLETEFEVRGPADSRWQLKLDA